MDMEEIVKFENSLAKLSLTELEEKRAELQGKIARMVSNSSVAIQLALIETQIKERR